MRVRLHMHACVLALRLRRLLYTQTLAHIHAWKNLKKRTLPPADLKILYMRASMGTHVLVNVLQHMNRCMRNTIHS